MLSVIKIQNKDGKYIEHNFFVGLLILAWRRNWDSLMFCIDFATGMELRIPYGQVEGFSIGE